MGKSYTVDLEPVGRRIETESGLSLLDATQAAGVELVSICGGGGTCGTCRVRLVSGDLSPLTLDEKAELSKEEIRYGIRLACQSIPQSDVRVDIPPESLTTPQRLQIEGFETSVGLDPIVVPVDLMLQPPNLNDLRADATRLQQALHQQGFPSPTIPLAVLKDLSNRLRSQNWAARVAVRSGKVVTVLPPQSQNGSPPPLLGLAVDIGTTKLASYLVNLENGEILAKAGAMNPQIGYGEDVVSRIAYANDHSNGRNILQIRLVETLNQLVAKLCGEIQAYPEQIVEAVVVGNTVMHHIFASLPLSQLGVAPYVPAVSDAMEVLAHEIGLVIARGATVYLPPNIAGYVGADHVAMLLAMDIGLRNDQAYKTIVALDIGTNTEITLAAGERLLTCSCASGPAFEGAHIHDGMRAAPGAIERVKIDHNQVLTYTIGGQAPVGICGSGILDTVSEMLYANVIDERGVLIAGHRFTRLTNGKPEFVLVPANSTGIGRDLVITREDVHEIQLAKGAIRAGVEILLSEAGKTDQDIDEFIVAGAFGTYLNLGSAIHIGMFPDIPIQRFHQVGNAAGMGARQMLISGHRRQLARQITNKIEYIELTTHPMFTEAYVDALLFTEQSRTNASRNE